MPDPADRHVLAAAIKAGAQVIVTRNLRTSPLPALDPLEHRGQVARRLRPDEIHINLRCRRLHPAYRTTPAPTRPKSVEDILTQLNATASWNPSLLFVRLARKQ